MEVYFTIKIFISQSIIPNSPLNLIKAINTIALLIAALVASHSLL